jgi:hypothetical protein
MANKESESDCSNLRHGRDCLERNARKVCDSCKEFDRQERLKDLQRELTDEMDDLAGVRMDRMDPSIQTEIDVADMFCRLLVFRFKTKYGQLDNLGAVPIPLLRKFATYAAGFGLDEITARIHEHIALRHS